MSFTEVPLDAPIHPPLRSGGADHLPRPGQCLGWFGQPRPSVHPERLQAAFDLGLAADEALPVPERPRGASGPARLHLPERLQRPPSRRGPGVPG